MAKINNDDLNAVIGIINSLLNNNGKDFIAVENILDKLSFKLPKGLKLNEVLNTGKYQVISQSKVYSIGFSNNEDLLINKDLPLIAFGDHSKTIKFIDKEFVIGADGVKLLKTKKDFDSLFVFYFLHGIITDTKDYGRHFSLLKKGFIPKLEIKEQKEFVRFLEDTSYKPSIKYIDEIKNHVLKFLKEKKLNKEISSEITHQLDLIKDLRQAFLHEAMQGVLVSNETQSGATGTDLLAEIQAEKNQLVKEKKIKKPKTLAPITEDELPFDIPKNWTWCKVDDISIKIGSGSTPKGSNYSENGFPFFRSQNIKNEGLVFDDIKFVSDEVQNQMIGTQVLANDLLLNITGGSLGRCALVPNDFNEGNVSQHVCILRGLKVLPKFYHLLVLSPYFQKLIFSSTTGAGREGLPKYTLEQFIIPLPPLEIQERIVAKLDELMAVCDALETQVKQSQLTNQQLLQQALREALGA